MLGEVGITLETSLHGFVEYAGLRDTGIPDGMTLVDRGAANEPDHTLSFYLPGNPLNASQVDDPELTELILKQRQELNPVERKKLVDEAQRYVSVHMYYVPINAPLVASLFQDYVVNYSNKEGYDRTPYALIWLRDNAPGRSFTP
jgi:ABC-type transport system substrate-binding protein